MLNATKRVPAMLPPAICVSAADEPMLLIHGSALNWQSWGSPISSVAVHLSMPGRLDLAGRAPVAHWGVSFPSARRKRRVKRPRPYLRVSPCGLHRTLPSSALHRTFGFRAMPAGIHDDQSLDRFEHVARGFPEGR